MSNKENSYKALLLDLDGTLLDLKINQFIAAYIEALVKKFSGYIKQEDFARHLFGVTRVMVANEDVTTIPAASIQQRLVGFSILHVCFFYMSSPDMGPIILIEEGINFTAPPVEPLY